MMSCSVCSTWPTMCSCSCLCKCLCLCTCSSAVAVALVPRRKPDGSSTHLIEIGCIINSTRQHSDDAL